MRYRHRDSLYVPPTAPDGSARLRVTLSAEHSEEQVDRLLDALDQSAGVNL